MSVPCRLACLTRGLRVLLCACLASLSAALCTAHEVRPTVGDLSVSGGFVTLDLDLNVEAFVAGVDLDRTQDTNEVPQAEAYDALRALDPDALGERFAPVAEEMARDIGLTRADGSALALAFAGADLGPVGNVETLRDSRARFTAEAGADIESLTLAWPDGYGALILRQVGVAEGYTGFLDGGMRSDPIVFAGTTAGSGIGTGLDFIAEGFALILPGGPEQALFLLGLVVLSWRREPLIWQLSAVFTGMVAGVVLGSVWGMGLPLGLVAPLLSVSLLYVGLENMETPRMRSRRPALALGFGYLHGLGLIAALGAAGLPAAQTGWALAGLLCGVGIASLTVLSLAYLCFGHWFAEAPWYRQRIALPISGAIALFGAWSLLSPVLRPVLPF